MRLREDRRIFPGEREAQLLAAVEQLDVLDQLRLRRAYTAAGSEEIASIVEPTVSTTSVSPSQCPMEWPFVVGSYVSMSGWPRPSM
jgi:hypothetical protein